MRRVGTAVAASVAAVSLSALLFSALAANGIAIVRGDDSVLFGSCVPSLAVENGSTETVDYLEVELVVTLANGEQRPVELQSAYREGIPHPIAPGGRAVLRQHLDTSRSLGVPCGEVRDRKVGRIVCEAGGKACASPVSVKP